MLIPLFERMLSRVAAQEFLRTTNLQAAFGAVLRRIDADRLGVTALEAERVTRIGVDMAVRATDAMLFPDDPINRAGLPEMRVELAQSGQYHWDFVIGYTYQENGVDKKGYVPVMYTSDQALSFNEALGKAIEKLDQSMDLRNKYQVAQNYTILLDEIHLLRTFFGV